MNSQSTLKSVQDSIEEYQIKERNRKAELVKNTAPIVAKTKKNKYVPTLEDICVMREYERGMYSGD